MAQTPPPASTREPADGFLQAAVRAFTEPSPRIREPQIRRRARLLSALLVGLFPVSFVAAVVIPFLTVPDYRPGGDRAIVFAQGIVGMSLVSYAVSRTRHYYGAAAVTVLVAVVGTWGVFLLSLGTPRQEAAPYFLGISVLMSSILLPRWATFGLMMGNLVALPLVPYADARITLFDVSNPFIFNLFVSTFILVFAQIQHRDLVQIQDQARHLRESETKWRSLAVSVPDTILMVDRLGSILFANRVPSGFRMEAVLGSRVYDYLPTTERARMEIVIARAFDSSEPAYFEMQGVGANGKVALLATRVTPIRDGDRVSYSTIVTTDITEQRRLEEERQRNAERAHEIEKLRELAQLKTAFINSAAHELSTPLTPILLQVQLLKDTSRHRLTHDQLRGLELLERNVERMRALLSDVLDGARIQANKLSIRPQRMDLNAIVREAADTHAPLAATAGIALDCAAPDSIWIDGDPNRLSQVLFNLLNNALKFTPRGGRIHVTSRLKGRQALVSVLDSGEGLAAEKIDRLFEPFSQVHDTMQRTRSGTGLGLYISRGIIEGHGGRLWCESAGPGHGATFQFLVPVAHAEAPSHRTTVVSEMTA